VAESETEVDKLRVAIQKPTFRRAFYDDPSSALKSEGIDAGQIPEGLLETLRGLSVGELGLIARVTHELEAEGLVGDEIMLRMPV
jgi:hypothetical protein